MIVMLDLTNKKHMMESASFGLGPKSGTECYGNRKPGTFHAKLCHFLLQLEEINIFNKFRRDKLETGR